MTPMHVHSMEENIIARLDHDEKRERFIFRLIDTDAGETITTRIFTNEAQALHYFEGWLNPLRSPVSIFL